MAVPVIDASDKAARKEARRKFREDRLIRKAAAAALIKTADAKPRPTAAKSKAKHVGPAAAAEAAASAATAARAAGQLAACPGTTAPPGTAGAPAAAEAMGTPPKKNADGVAAAAAGRTPCAELEMAAEVFRRHLGRTPSTEDIRRLTLTPRSAAASPSQSQQSQSVLEPPQPAAAAGQPAAPTLPMKCTRVDTTDTLPLELAETQVETQGDAVAASGKKVVDQPTVANALVEGEQHAAAEKDAAAGKQVVEAAAAPDKHVAGEEDVAVGKQVVDAELQNAVVAGKQGQPAVAGPDAHEHGELQIVETGKQDVVERVAGESAAAAEAGGKAEMQVAGAGHPATTSAALSRRRTGPPPRWRSRRPHRCRTGRPARWVDS